jgi:hypothetical protein
MGNHAANLRAFPLSTFYLRQAIEGNSNFDGSVLNQKQCVNRELEGELEGGEMREFGKT